MKDSVINIFNQENHMLHIQQVTFLSRNSDKDSIIQFLLNLTSNSLYRPIVEEISRIPGYVRRETIIVDDINGTSVSTRIIFNDPDSFLLYDQNEGHQSIWEYVKIMADTADIDCEITNLVVEQ